MVYTVGTHGGMAEIAGVDIAGVDNDGVSRRGRHIDEGVRRFHKVKLTHLQNATTDQMTDVARLRNGNVLRHVAMHDFARPVQTGWLLMVALALSAIPSLAWLYASFCRLRHILTDFLTQQVLFYVRTFNSLLSQISTPSLSTPAMPVFYLLRQCPLLHFQSTRINYYDGQYMHEFNMLVYISGIKLMTDSL